jgi:5-methylthioadenosine/S-adenosylhomocysteine deaminase
MLRSGTTCFNDNYFYSESIGRATADANMRAVLGTCIIDFSTSYAQTPDEYIAKATELYQTYKNHPFITVSIAPHAPYSVSDDTFLKIKTFAEKYPVNIHLHLHETAEEINQSLKQFHKRPIQRIYDLGLMSKRLECIHMTQIVAEDIQLLQKTRASVVHCPESNLKLASGFSPVKQFIDAKITTALGTDGTASNNDLDMFGEMHTAALLAKSVAQDPTALNAAEILRMATLEGARAIGLDRDIGSIEAGKSADIIAVDLSSINTQPIYNPISHLVYAVNSRQVTDVWIAGKRLLKSGKFTMLDEKAIKIKIKKWSKKIL